MITLSPLPQQVEPLSPRAIPRLPKAHISPCLYLNLLCKALGGEGHFPLEPVVLERLHSHLQHMGWGLLTQDLLCGPQIRNERVGRAAQAGSLPCKGRHASGKEARNPSTDDLSKKLHVMVTCTNYKILRDEILLAKWLDTSKRYEILLLVSNLKKGKLRHRENR